MNYCMNIIVQHFVQQQGFFFENINITIVVLDYFM